MGEWCGVCVCERPLEAPRGVGGGVWGGVCVRVCGP